MAERLAVRAQPEQKVPESPRSQEDFDAIASKAEHEAFDSIVDNYDKDLDRSPSEDISSLDVMDNRGSAPLSDAELLALNEIEAQLDGKQSGGTASNPSPTMLAPVSLPSPTSAPTLPPTPSSTLPTSRPVTPQAPIPASPPPSTPPVIHSAMPTTTTERPSEFKVVLLDQTKDAKDAAKDAADARLDRELKEGGRAKRFLKGIWKGNLFKEYYRQRYSVQAEQEIREAQDVLIHQESSPQARARATQAVLERFGYTQYEETVHRRAGEDRTEMEANSRVSLEAKELIRRYVNGELKDDVFAERRREFASRHSGEVSMDNLFEIAQTVKGVVEHGESLENVLGNMKIITGEVRAGARTQAEYNWTDRIIEKLSNTKLGRLVPDELLAAAGGIATSLIKLGTTKLAAAAASGVAVASGLVLVGTIAGVAGVAATAGVGVLRERKRVADEKARHTREMVMGGVIDAPPEPQNWRQRLARKLLPNRRVQFEEARVTETVATAGEVAQNLRTQIDMLALDDANLPPGTTREAALRNAITILAAAEARNHTTDTTRNEVLGWTGAAAGRDERTEFDLARARLKVMIRNQLGDAERISLATDLDMNDPGRRSLDEILDRQGVALVEAIEAESSTKDKIYRKLRRKRMTLVGAAILVGGLTIGTAIHESIALVADNRIGAAESLSAEGPNPRGEGERQTLLSSVFKGEIEPSHVGPSGTFADIGIGEKNVTWSLSDDHKMVANADGTYNLVDRNGGTTVENFKINADGTMPEETKSLFESKGIHSESADKLIPGEVVSQQVTPEQHLANHIDQAPAVEVDDWMDNDTEGPVFDKNEHGLHWTGTGYVAEASGGNSYHLNVSNMTEGGSYHNGESISWVEEARKGNLTLRVSPIENSLQAFIVPISPDGSIDIAADHPAAQYFSAKNGQASFDGFKTEVARLNGVGADGVHHVDVLATLVGTGEAEGRTVQDFVKGPDTIQPGYKIVTNGYDVAGITAEWPPFVPIRSRRSLEVLGRRNPRISTVENAPYYNGYDGIGSLSPERLKQLQEETSPRLWSDPEAALNPAQELSWYRNQLIKNNGVQYVNDIDNAITLSPELNNFPSSVRNVVTIPVNAAGQSESDGIYDRIARHYALQDKEAMDHSMLLLHVNWFSDLVSDPQAGARIEKTKSEVERAKADFPALKIATFESEWERSDYPNGVTGAVGRRMNNVALLAIERAVASGGHDGNVLIIRNDADAVGTSKNYMKSMDNAALQYPDTDVFTGTTSFDNTKAGRLPGLVFASNFMQAMELLNATRGRRVHTAGANFGVRAVTLAAVGGSGFEGTYSGAASDDVEIGRRIEFARDTTRVGGSYASVSTTSGVYSASRSGYIAGGSPAASSGSTRRVARRVAGARIDTDSDRQEARYRSGQPIITTWSKGAFDKNGYVERDAGLRRKLRFGRENLRRQMDDVIDRVERDMRATIEVFGSDALARSSLAFMFAGQDGGSTDAYDLRFNSSNGSVDFSFTPSGRRKIAKHLLRDGKGRSDPYGRRKMRQMYGSSGFGHRRALRRQMLA
jgi:hypothetical protein